MPDDLTPAGTQADPSQQAKPQAGVSTPAPTGSGTQADPSQSPGSDQNQSMSLEEAKKLRAESASLRKRIAEFEAAQKAADDAKLSDQQRLEKQLATYQEQLAALQIEQQTYRLAREIAKHAPSLNLIDPDAALLMLQAGGEVDCDDAGHPTNVAKLLEKLVAEKPYLIASNVTRPPAPPSSGGATHPARSAAPPPAPPKVDPKEAYKRHQERGGLTNPAIWKH